MLNRRAPQELIQFIDSHEGFLLLTHMDPDGDCIGSSLALGDFLSRIGKRVRHFNPGPFGRREILEYASQFERHVGNHDREFSASTAVIVIDCSSADRIGHLANEIDGLPIAVIDHHSTGKDFGDVRFINPSSPSASLLIEQLIEDMGYLPSESEANFMFFAFSTDTGFFRFLEAGSQESFRMVARLVEAGVSPRSVYQKIHQGVSLDSRRHMGFLLERCQSYFGGQFLYTWESKDEIARFGRENRDSDALYQQLMSVDRVEILVVLREEEGLCTGSIRTSQRIDAGALAAEFGGGGHVRAAGFSQDSSIADCFQRIQARIGELLQSDIR